MRRISRCAKVASGQAATITLSALTGTSVPGKVTAVSPISTIVSNVVTYDVTVALTAPPSDVKPGMTATVEINTGRRRVIDYALSPLREAVAQTGHER